MTLSEVQTRAKDAHEKVLAFQGNCPIASERSKSSFEASDTSAEDTRPMEKFDRTINSWLREHLIPKLAGVFQERCSPDDIESSVALPKGSFFLSDLFFASIRFPGQERRVLVKLPPQDPVVRTIQNYDHLFANEILFYQKIADKESSDFAKCFLSGEDPVFEKFIVLEDVCTRGFSICTKKVFVHIDYVIAGLQSIARFHGNNYDIKEKSPDKFRQILKDIIKVRYNENPINEGWMKSINSRLKRMPRIIRERNLDAKFTEEAVSLFDDAYKIMMRTVKPTEPLATVIHGDVTINNIMYCEAETNQGKHLKAMLVDFALLMYSSPSVDVSHFLYMCCSREDIKNYTRKLVRVYHDCLAQELKQRGIWNPTKYSFEAFWRDYKERAIHGYMIAAYFLPMMVEFEKDNDLLQRDHDHLEKINATGGGETLSNTLVDMLIDMREAGFLDCYVNNNNNTNELAV